MTQISLQSAYANCSYGQKKCLTLSSMNIVNSQLLSVPLCGLSQILRVVYAGKKTQKKNPAELLRGQIKTLWFNRTLRKASTLKESFCYCVVSTSNWYAKQVFWRQKCQMKISSGSRFRLTYKNIEGWKLQNIFSLS